MTLDEIHAIDPSGMYGLLRQFPAQVREAVALGRAAEIPVRKKQVDAIVLSGLGGSAIGGDLLRSYLADELRIPFIVNRHYTLPAWVGPRTLVIISSYSGNTEETIAVHREALRRRARILCITSGGGTLRLARRRKNPCILIPGGLPPRAALAYSFFPLLLAVIQMGFAKQRDRDLKETITVLDEKTPGYAVPDVSANRALQLAELLRNRLGVFYSSTERLDAVTTRWRGQMAENAKTLTFGNVLPEMNHNELVGWKTLQEQMREIQVFLLRDRDDHPRVQMRMDITKGILAGYTPRITEVWSEGSSLLTRIVSLVHLGDWVSFYLAVLHTVDPTPVAVIDYLKKELAKT